MMNVQYVTEYDTLNDLLNTLYDKQLEVSSLLQSMIDDRIEQVRQRCDELITGVETQENINMYTADNWYDKVDRVIYTLKDYPATVNDVNVNTILTTTVYFTDNTRSVVKTSKFDKVGLVFHKDGTVTPDEDSKRLGLMYAVTKRMLGAVDETGDVTSNGYMYKLTKIVNAGIDSNQSAIRHAREKAEAKERHKKMLEEAKARKAKANEAKQKESFCWDSFCETYPTLNELLLKLIDKMTPDNTNK